MAVINIKDLFQKAFNVVPRYLIPNYSDLEALPRDYTGMEIWPDDQPAEISDLGTPILEKIKLSAGSYKGFVVVDQEPRSVNISYEDYTFPGWAMIDVSQNKVIVKTAVNGRNGTIKEYIYKDDYRITIRGILVGEGNSYPYELKKQLQAIFNVNAAVEVVSKTMNDIGIQAIVMESMEMTDIEGYNNVCTYSITAVSDKGVLLTIKEINQS